MATCKASVVVATAKKQVGYKEGKNNWTKYARDLDSVKYYTPQKKQNVAWCATFKNWLIWIASGKNKNFAQSIQGQPHKNNLSAGVKYDANYFRKIKRFYKTPKVADVIYFGKKGAETHEGIISYKKGSIIKTIEGNSGNAVKQHTYAVSNKKIVGYGRPKYTA